MKRTVSLVLCFLLVFALCPPAFAAGSTITWTEAIDNDWSKAENWDPQQVPGDGDTAVIPASSVVSVVYATLPVTLDCSGEVSVEASGHLYLTGTSYLRREGDLFGVLIGDGDITITGDGSELWMTGGYIDGSGLLTLEENTSLVVQTGTAGVSVGRYVVNEGQITVDDGCLYLYGGGEGQGTFTVSEGTYVEFDEGTYNLGGDFVNGGEVSIWDEASVRVNADFVQQDTGVLALKVWGDGPSDYSKLVVDGEAQLGGVLEIDFFQSYDPELGDSFEILTYGSRTGEFSSITNNMDDEGIHLAVTYTATGLTLTVEPQPEFAGGSGTEEDPYLFLKIATSTMSAITLTSTSD